MDRVATQYGDRFTAVYSGPESYVPALGSPNKVGKAATAAEIGIARLGDGVAETALSFFHDGQVGPRQLGYSALSATIGGIDMADTTLVDLDTATVAFRQLTPQPRHVDMRRASLAALQK